ncbi:DNA repair protein XRCC2-like protein isoform X5 [Iris pallida]|uniref:DNA repair protein XRCC2-like protein isoform X5 n=1 Tax=Iris pallida TaxID=29817 RepID=A0AAX6H388_IRIPA|nr:DNA repair protein XRCC2-like protein isoform X5 [Iris pallida]
MRRMEEENPSLWTHGDETAKEFLSRVFTERPLSSRRSTASPSASATSSRSPALPPPPNPKSTQAAVNCILPKEWKGVHYGGLGKMVMYFDLDCRFDVLRLYEALKHRIAEASGLAQGTCWRTYGDLRRDEPVDAHIGPCNNELLLACMRRFLYIRCYNSFEFLSALKANNPLSDRKGKCKSW